MTHDGIFMTLIKFSSRTYPSLGTYEVTTTSNQYFYRWRPENKACIRWRHHDITSNFASVAHILSLYQILLLSNLAFNASKNHMTNQSNCKKSFECSMFRWRDVSGQNFMTNHSKGIMMTPSIGNFTNKFPCHGQCPHHFW